MKFRGNMKLGWVLFMMGLLLGFQGLEAATFLGESSAVRESKDKDDDDDDDDDDGFSLFSFFRSSSDKKSPPKETVVIDSTGGNDGPTAWENLQDDLTEDVPEDWMPNRLRTSFEIGLQHWEPYSRSGQFDADYDIDPVTVTTVDTSVRVKSWVVMLDYTTSITDPENMKNLLAQVSRITPGAGMWWALYAEKGEVEGTADTEDALGNPVMYPVDTEWNRLGIELRTYYGVYAGLVWEDLTMPVIHTFNNEEIAFAVFDDQTRARTLSIAIGYDKARYLLNDFKKGGAWAWSLEGSLGLGWLTYSEDEVRGYIEGLGYETESTELLVAGSIDGRLGYTYSMEILSTDVQLYAGVRCRASGWKNLAGDPPEDPQTVGLDTGFGLVQPGVFGRISFQW